MSATTMTAGAWHRFELEHPDQHAVLKVWIEDVVGDLDWVLSVTLGEGRVTAERACEPITVVDDHVVTYTTEHLAPTPPPCWPAGDR